MASFDQNRNFEPSWKMRGVLVLLICPKSALVTPELGFVNCVWLKVLKVSARNSNLRSFIELERFEHRHVPVVASRADHGVPRRSAPLQGSRLLGTTTC